MILDTEIQGVPCKVRVIYYRAAVPGRTWGPPELCYPEEPAEVEFVVLDELGRPDPGLEAMMDSADVRAIEEEAVAAMEACDRAEQVQAQEDRAEDQHILEQA